MFHLKIFTPEALNRQAKARWNATTREADSETDMELANLLAEDDDLNFMDEPTMEKPMLEEKQDAPGSVVTMNIPSFPAEHIPSMAQDEDSISTFHPGRVVNLTEENELAKAATQERISLRPQNNKNQMVCQKCPCLILRQEFLPWKLSYPPCTRTLKGQSSNYNPKPKTML
jgi:hypothetical protein